ncbi:MAG: 50S ribosomal protein L10 [Fimbriimonadaceae bacterium]
MPTAAKVKQVSQIKERYERASGVIFTEYRGLSVPAIQRLRRSLADQGAEFSVVKNTLFKRAAGDDAANIPEAMTSGPTAVAFVYQDDTATAKALFDFIKENKAFVVKGGYLDGRLYDGAQMEALSKLPPKDVLMAQLIGVIAAPLSNIVGVIQEIYAAPIRAIGAVADKAAESAPQEAAPAPPTPSGQQADDEQATAEPHGEALPASEPAAEAEAAEAPVEAPTDQPDQPTEEAAPEPAPTENTEETN